MGSKQHKRQEQIPPSRSCCQRQKGIAMQLAWVLPCRVEQASGMIPSLDREGCSPALLAQSCPQLPEGCAQERCLLSGLCASSSKERASQTHKHFKMYGKTSSEACLFLTLHSLASLYLQREGPVRKICYNRSCFVRNNMEAPFETLCFLLSLSQEHWHEINLIWEFKGLNSVFFCDC